MRWKKLCLSAIQRRERQSVVLFIYFNTQRATQTLPANGISWRFVSADEQK